MGFRVVERDNSGDQNVRVQIPFHYFLAQCSWKSLFTLFIKYLCMPGTILNTVKTIAHLSLRSTPWKRNYYYPYFIDEETKGHDRLMTLPKDV